MSHRLPWCVAVLTLTVSAQAIRADRIMTVPPVAKPVMQAMQAGVIVLGKISEIEKDTVEASPFRGAVKEQRVPYKIAVLKIEDPLAGARGLTQLRVGFFADAPVHVDPALPRTAVPSRRVNVAGNVALTAGMDGVFMLVPHHEGDFYVVVVNGAPIIKKELNFDKELAEVKKIAAAIDDPVTALKAKDKADRSTAAQILLNRYRTRPFAATVIEEEIPAEENKLLVQAVAELPWLPEGNEATKPSRSGLWSHLQAERLGFKPPVFDNPRPGNRSAEFAKQWDETTTEFLKANADKIKIKKFVAKK